MENNEKIGFYKTNLAFLLADIANGFLLDGQELLRKHGRVLRNEDKYRWKRMLTEIERARKATKEASIRMYETEIVDIACEESDNMADIIWTIVERANGPADLVRVKNKIIKSFTVKRQLT